MIILSELPIELKQEFFNSYSKALIFKGNPENRKKDISINRVELYPSGTNRIIINYQQNNNILGAGKLREREDITQFSAGARRRFFVSLNRINYSDIIPYFLTLTFPVDFDKFITAENLKTLIKRFNNKVLSEKFLFDFHYKVEYTRNRVPHIHYIIYKKGAQIENLEEMRHYLAKEFFTFFRYYMRLSFSPSLPGSYRYCDNGLSTSWKVLYHNQQEENAHIKSAFYMWNGAGCTLEPPKKTVEAMIYYVSFYFTKKKEYQNEIPEKYYGVRTWGKSKKNYPELFEEIKYINLNFEKSLKLFQVAQMNLSKKDKKFYKPVGSFFLPQEQLRKILYDTKFLEDLNFISESQHLKNLSVLVFKLNELRRKKRDSETLTKILNSVF